eukprot:CAMPEP_0194265864 /NCGR_PEP_ID=MMETSP0169-20130528/959_1 /TAXON_ID=218684 /ORGANISM="Corethron pennatum, Strain L29A3" /LENGTH=165 /DNA_ID=CAMNT_0039006423 /DNA_START=901 /DNA_END=1399 /DNA_ORIENTATION=-
MSHHVVSKVVADVEVVDASELSKLSEHILVELQETLLGLRLVNDCTPPVTSHSAGYFRLPHWVRVYVPNKDSLAECWTVVKPATSVAVTACADLEEKGAVDLVFFCAVDASEVDAPPGPSPEPGREPDAPDPRRRRDDEDLRGGAAVPPLGQGTQAMPFAPLAGP